MWSRRQFYYFLLLQILAIFPITNQEEISAVGRLASIGDVYDIIKDEFTNENIFENPVPLNSGLITPTIINTKSTKTMIVRTLLDKVNFCQIEPSQAVSILDGTISPKGSSKYLREKPHDPNTIEGAAAHTIRTVKYKLNLHGNSPPGVTRSVMLNTIGTHIVVGITYGATVIASWIDLNPKNVEKETLENEILSALLKLPSSGQLKHQRFHAFGDVTLSHEVLNNPVKLYSFFANMRNSTELLQDQNHFKGFPLKYHLAPIAQLAIKADLSPASVGRNFTSVDISLLQETIEFFYQIFNTQHRLNKIGKLPFLSRPDALWISQQRSEVEKTSRRFPYSVKKCLIEIKSKTKEESILVNVLDDGNAILKNYTATISDFEEKYRSQIGIYEGLANSGVEYLGNKITLDKFIMTHVDKPVFLLLQNTSLIESDQKTWQENLNLLITIFNKPWNKCAVADCNFHEQICSNINETTIFQYVATKLLSKDVRQDCSHFQSLPSIKIQALGRPRQIGDLFDANHRTFVDGSLFKTGSLQKLPISTTNQTNHRPSSAIKNTWQQFFEAFEVPAFQKLSSLYRSKEAGITRNFEVIQGHSKSTGYCIVQTYVDRRLNLELTSRDGLSCWTHEVSLSTLVSAIGATHFVQQIDIGVATLIGILSEDVETNYSNEAVKMQEIINKYTRSLHNPANLTSGLLSNLTTFNSTYIVLHNGEEVSTKSYHNADELRSYLGNLDKYLPTRLQPVAYVLHPLANLQTKFGFLPNIPTLMPLPTSRIVARSVAALDILEDKTIEKEIQNLHAEMLVNRECMISSNFEKLQSFINDRENSTFVWTSILKDSLREFQTGELTNEELTQVLNDIDTAFPSVDQQKSSFMTKFSDIKERILFCELCRQSSVRFISSPTDFNQAVVEDSKIEWNYHMYFRREWRRTMSLRWEEIQYIFFQSLPKILKKILNNATSSIKYYMVDCDFFPLTNDSICSNIDRPTIHEYRHRLLILDNVDTLSLQKSNDNSGLIRETHQSNDEFNDFRMIDLPNNRNASLVRGLVDYLNRRVHFENILTNPRAKLFTATNMAGNSEYYDSRTPTYLGGCYNLKHYASKIKSVDTMGKCVRLFSGGSCQGWSQAFYPGSSTEFNAKLNGVYSVGLCVENEFEFATIVNVGSSSVNVQKVECSNTLYKSVPDFVGDRETRSGFTSVSSNSNPISSYLLGHGNRIEALAGTFYNRHIRTPSQAESNRIAGQSQSFYRNLVINNNTDEVGFAFPLELAGPADQIYNVFPQDRIQAEKYKQTIVPLFKQFLTENTGGHVYFTISFFYENATSLRPKAIWYRYSMHSNSVLHELRYAYFPN